MYPRLKLLHKLLANDGAIFISLDDNEQANMRLVCNEIFGDNNFYTQIIVQSNVRGHTYRQIAKTHEYILVYTKSYATEFNEIPKDEENSDLNLTDDIGKFNIRELRNRNPKFGRFNRPNLFYPFYIDPNSIDDDGLLAISLERDEAYSIEVLPKNSSNEDSCWRWGQSLSEKNISENTKLSNLVAKSVRTGGYNIYEKYRKETVKAKTIWFDTDFITERGTVELGKLDLSIFEFPKPVALIERAIQLASNSESIILDSFAGSGTTAHAVLNANKQDDGNRKFILIEMEDYADTITAERVKRVIDGYGATEGTGGSFEYFELGEPLLIDGQYLNEEVPTETIRSYIWYMETRRPLPDISSTDDNDYLLGSVNNTVYYFNYQKDRLTTLDADFLATMKTKGEGYVIYADQCAINNDVLKRYGITFKKIPRDIAKL
jgi:adenine-specific DNA-methyltransferase